MPPQMLSRVATRWRFLKIGIGGNLAAPPSHTTVRTGPYTAVRQIKHRRFVCLRLVPETQSWISACWLRPFEQRCPGFTLSPPFRRPVTWIFRRMAGSRFPHPSVFPAFRPSAKLVPPTTPSADFSAAITSLTTRSVRCPGHDGDLPR
jgi:hypothetical protein